MTETTTEHPIQERIGKLVEEAQALLKEIEDEGATALEEATALSWENVRKYRAAVGALENDAARAESLRKEREQLPVEHSRAILADNEEETHRLKSRFGELEEELETIEERRPRLEAKVAELGGANTARLPKHLKADGCLLYQQRGVTTALDPTFQHLSLLDKEVVGKIASVLNKFRAKARKASDVGSEISHAIFNDPLLGQQRRESAQRHVNMARSRGR